MCSICIFKNLSFPLSEYFNFSTFVFSLLVCLSLNTFYWHDFPWSFSFNLLNFFLFPIFHLVLSSVYLFLIEFPSHIFYRLPYFIHLNVFQYKILPRVCVLFDFFKHIYNESFEFLI